MTAYPQSAFRLSDIEARQDAVLRQLEELEARIIKVLAEHGVAPATGPAAGPTVLRIVSDENATDETAGNVAVADERVSGGPVSDEAA